MLVNNSWSSIRRLIRVPGVCFALNRGVVVVIGLCCREVGKEHKHSRLIVRNDLSLRQSNRWRWRPLDIVCSICKTVDIAMRDRFRTIRSNVSSKAASEVLDGVIHVLVFPDKGGTKLIEQLPLDIVFKFPVSLDVCSASRRKLRAKPVVNTFDWIISVSRWQHIVLRSVR